MPGERYATIAYIPQKEEAFQGQLEEFMLSSDDREKLIAQLASYIANTGVNLHRKSMIVYVDAPIDYSDDSELQQIINECKHNPNNSN